MAKSILEVVMQGVDKLSGPMRKAGESVSDFEKRSKASSDRLKALGKTALATTATLAAVGLAAKKAFDLGKEGAAIKQTGQSFDFLIKKVGASADLLDQLRTASRGTISDMDLMSSTATLLAGAQGELATELAQSTPRLLEIAKAAQKLNPALGSTTFLYDSLATGVKRASPMILDNLGLTIRLGAANSAYAEELGKTVAELTAAEMKQALLNETLRAGAVLIEQAGGTTESATDEYDIFETAIGNLTDAMKVNVHEGMRPMIKVLSEATPIFTDNITATVALKDAQAKSLITEEQYRKAVLDLRHGVISHTEALELVTEATRKAKHAGTLHEEQQVVLRKTLHGTTAEVMEQSRVAAMAADAAARLASGIDGLAGSEQLVQLESKELAQILKDELALATDKTTQEIIDAEKELKELTAEFLESGVASEEASQEITDLTIHIEDLKTKLNTAVPSVHELALGLGEIASAWDQAKIAMAPGLSLLEDVEEQIIDTSGSTEQWARVTDEVSLALGDKNYAIITAERRLRTLERRVKDNVVSFEDSEEAIIAARIALANANAAFADSNVVVKDNTYILRNNTEQRLRSSEISDAHAKLVGRENDETLALRDTILMQTEAYEKMGSESGFTAEGIALLTKQYDDGRDALRDLHSETTRVTSAIKEQGKVSIATGMSVLAMRRALVTAGGAYWETASAQQVESEFKSLAEKQKKIEQQFPNFEGHKFIEAPGTESWSAEKWMQEYGYRGLTDYPKMDFPIGSLPAEERDKVLEMFRSGSMPFASGAPVQVGQPGPANVSSGQQVHMSPAEYEAHYGWRREHPGMEMPTLAAHGANFMVPPQHPNDSFMMGVSSGERVSVTPSHMLGGGNGGGLTVNTINVYGVQTASSLYEEVVKAARQRGRAFAKVM